MAIDTEDRIEALLDQLEKPNLSEGEIEKIERRIKFLQQLNT